MTKSHFKRVCLAIAALILLLVYLLSLRTVHAHESAAWIQQGQYKNAIGELCCGERDCAEVPAEDVQVVPGGYLIKSINEFIPHREALPSPGGYWRCYWGGKRKCFFAPFSGS